MRHILPVLLVSMLVLPQQTSLAQQVGTAAAVVPDAFDRTTATPRRIELGDAIIRDQRIETDGAGMVQILLADGSAFTVGPNSSLVIDSFVYNPDTDTATLAATASRGFLRFIGGAASKGEGGASITTPVGTAGIRGAIADIVATPTGSMPPSFSLVYGSGITLQTPSGQTFATNQPGSSIIATGGGITTGPTPPQITAGMQQGLSAPPGGQTPGNVSTAQVNAGVNSMQSAGGSPGSPQAGLSSPSSIQPFAGTPNISDDAVQGQNRNTIVSNSPTTPPTTTPPTTTPFEPAYAGFASAIAGGSPRLGTTNLTVDTGAGTIEGEVTLDGGGGFSFGTEDATYNARNDFSASNVTGNLTTASSGQTLCTSCDFLSWGTWGTTPAGNPTVASGYWTAGAATTAQQLVDLSETSTGSASYAGTAVGHIKSGEDIHDANGTVTGSVNFGNRSGYVVFHDFGVDGDRKSFEYGISYEAGTNTFTETNVNDYSETYTPGSLSGQFVNNGSTIADGMTGNFQIEIPLQDWSAAGVFGAKRQ